MEQRRRTAHVKVEKAARVSLKREGVAMWGEIIDRNFSGLLIESERAPLAESCYLLEKIFSREKGNREMVVNCGVRVKRIMAGEKGRIRFAVEYLPLAENFHFLEKEGVESSFQRPNPGEIIANFLDLC